MNTLESNSNLFLSLLKNRIAESQSLQYKKSAELFPVTDKKIEKLSVDVAAMANTMGGQILVGVVAKKRKPVQSELIKINEEKVIDLIFLLNQKISKPVSEILVQWVEIESGEGILQITVPCSKSAPHMCFDNRYYKRGNRGAEIMCESEVRAAYGKISKTEIDLAGIVNSNGIPSLLGGKFASVVFLPKFLFLNSGHVIEKNYKVVISIPTSLCDENYFAMSNNISGVSGNHTLFTFTAREPLFQDETINLLEPKLLVNKANINEFLKETIYLTIYYSYGVKSKEYKLSDAFRYNGKTLQATDFSDL